MSLFSDRFFLLLTIITLLAADLRVYLIGFLVFWMVRSIGETIYFFLEQFLEPKVRPHNIVQQLRLLEHAFGDIATQKAFILMQIMFQTVTVLSILGLILLLTHWQMVPAKF